MLAQRHGQQAARWEAGLEAGAEGHPSSKMAKPWLKSSGGEEINSP